MIKVNIYCCNFCPLPRIAFLICPLSFSISYVVNLWKSFVQSLESFRFLDENDYEYEIFSMLSSARAWGSVILVGKRGSRRHSTTSFNESVVAAGTSYQMLEVLAFWNRERAQPPSITITVLTFLVKKSTMKNSGVSIFWQYAKKL